MVRRFCKLQVLASQMNSQTEMNSLLFTVWIYCLRAIKFVENRQRITEAMKTTSSATLESFRNPNCIYLELKRKLANEAHRLAVGKVTHLDLDSLRFFGHTLGLDGSRKSPSSYCCFSPPFGRFPMTSMFRPILVELSAL